MSRSCILSPPLFLGLFFLFLLFLSCIPSIPSPLRLLSPSPGWVSSGQQHRCPGGVLQAGTQQRLLAQQEMENAWNEYLKLERDVEQLKQALQEQHRKAFFFQVT